MVFGVVVGFGRRPTRLAADVVVVDVFEYFATAACAVVGLRLFAVRLASRSADVKAVDRLVTVQLHIIKTRKNRLK